MSKAGPSLLRATFYRAADTARRQDPQLARIYYQQMTERGATHLKACCVVAGHLAERAWAVLHRGTPHVICDNNGNPVTLTEAKKIIAGRWTVPEQVREDGAAARQRGRPLRRPSPGRTSEATPPAPDRPGHPSRQSIPPPDQRRHPSPPATASGPASMPAISGKPDARKARPDHLTGELPQGIKSPQLHPNPHPWGPLSSRGCGEVARWPVWPSGWRDCSAGFSSQLPFRAVAQSGVQLERPQPRSGEDERAWRRPAAADHRERGKLPAGLGFDGRGFAGLVRGACGLRSGLTCTHPAPARWWRVP
jgi:hypothetical protein